MTAQFRLDGKTAVVTGAFGKLGPVWTRALLDAGATVAALDRAKGELPAHERLTVIAADVTSRASLEDAAAQVGDVDILVNNAGIDAPPATGTRTAGLTEIDPAVFRSILEVNLIGAFQCVQVFGAGMVSRGRGSIINIGSLYASVSPDARFYDHIPSDPPFLKPPAYGASKAALVNLTKYLAAHWGPAGVRVNALSPGGVEGNQDADFKRKFGARVPLGRMCKPEELEGPLVFLASDASMYVTGTELRVDGGFTAW